MDSRRTAWAGIGCDGNGGCGGGGGGAATRVVDDRGRSSGSILVVGSTMQPLAGRAGLISIVIPVLDEAESLAALAGELRGVAAKHELNMEVIFVDDGSRDGSWEVICRLAAEDRRLRGIRLRRNFGKAAALAAGFESAAGDVVFQL